MLQLMGLAFAKPQSTPAKVAPEDCAVAVQAVGGRQGRTQGIKQGASQVQSPAIGAVEDRSLVGHAQSNESASARGQQLKTVHKVNDKSTSKQTTQKLSKPQAAPAAKPVAAKEPKQAAAKKQLDSTTSTANKAPVKALQKAAPSANKVTVKTPAKPMQKTAAKTLASQPLKSQKISDPAAKKSLALIALATPPDGQLALPPTRKSAAAGPPPKPASARVAAAPVPNLKTGITLVNNATPTISAPVPTKPSRSARSLSLTVPSMAQSVASTAAKSSYSQLPAPAVLVPVVQANVVRDPKLASNWKSKSVEQLTDQEVIAMADEH